MTSGHEFRARDRVVCQGGRGLAGCAAGVAGVLDVALGSVRPADGDTPDRVPRRAWQARSRSRVRRDADGGYSRARPRVWLLPTPAGPRSDRGGRLIERHIKTEAARSVYDALLLPALNYAERDRLEARLSVDEETAVTDATRELLSDAAEAVRRLSPQTFAPPDDRPLPGPRKPLRVLGLAINGVADELALGMLVHLVDDLPIAFDITAARMQASELVSLVKEREFSVVCFADLPPSPPSKTRYLVKRLRAALPEVGIIVGRWAPPALADESTQVLREAGANHVGVTLLETREYLGGLVTIPRIPLPGTVSVGAQAA